MSNDEDELNREIRDHAWNWFALHATQRMQSFNFFLIATAFLVAAYASTLDKRPIAAMGIALLGTWLAVWFNRLDRRTRQLVNAGESALEVAQARLADRIGIANIKLLEQVKYPERGASTYRQIIAVVQWTVALAFLVAAIYAACSG